MLRVGIIGLGAMGRRHFEAYQEIPDVRVVAICDPKPHRAAGDVSGTTLNLQQGGMTRLPMEQGITGTTNYRELLARNDVDLVSVTVPTDRHVEVAIAALQSGKHVLCEKPLARNVDEARQIVAAAEQAQGMFMTAMCVRFWPGWSWLKEAIADNRYGAVLSAMFRRLATRPSGWLADPARSGGALVDFHIHDTDFAYFLFGKPKAVFSQGYGERPGHVDYVTTQYIYPRGPLVVAECGWTMADGFGFNMAYAVNFQRATAEYNFNEPQPLRIAHAGKAESFPCDGPDSYVREIKYFVDCVRTGQKPTVITPQDGVACLEILAAERRSIETGAIEPVPC